MKILGRMILAMALVVSLMSPPKTAEAVVVASAIAIHGYGTNKNKSEAWKQVMVAATTSGFMGLFLLQAALGATAGVGIIVLHHDSEAARFQSLSVEDGHHLALTENERLSFNNHVEIFNTVLEELQFNSDEHTTPEELSAAWAYYLDELNVDVEARFALEVVVENTFLSSY